VSVALIDTLVAVLAAVMIFPAVFSVGIQPSAGPSLVFITLPSIFNGLSFSWLWSTIFFLLLALAALTSTISIHEVVTAYVSEQWNVRRNSAAWLATVAMLVLGIICSLSFSVLNHWKVGGMSIFDLFDYVTANIMLPVGGIFTCLFVGWKIDQTLLKNEITNYGTARFIGIKTYVFILRWIAPICILLVLLNQLGIVNF
jgi:NSS family neurotransmitter:Na+ symporter